MRPPPPRIGTVPYLNARPLVRGLERAGEKADPSAPRPPTAGDLGMTLTRLPPADLAREFETGRLAAALVPAVAAAARPEYRIIPGIAIASDGPVESVLLFCRRPLPEVRRIAADSTSRSSTALLRILCREAFRIAPEFAPHDPAVGISPDADATMLIGDAALRSPRDGCAEVVDLAGAWKSLTGLPFVFAVWVVREGSGTRDLARALQDAKATGLAALPEIAREAAPDLGLPPDRCLAYLQRLRYDLGPREEDGMRLFLRKAGAPDAIRFMQPPPPTVVRP